MLVHQIPWWSLIYIYTFSTIISVTLADDAILQWDSTVPTRLVGRHCPPLPFNFMESFISAITKAQGASVGPHVCQKTSQKILQY